MGMSHDLEAAIEEGATMRARGDGAVRESGKSREGRILRAVAAGAHRRGRLRGGAAHRSAPAMAAWSRARARCDVALYHLGNNPLHREIYRRALAEPGVVVLHDAVLHHFFLGALDRAAYIDEFVYNYGEWHRGLAREDLWRARASSGFDRRYFDYPMLKRIAERSRAVVVHNPAAARMVRRARARRAWSRSRICSCPRNCPVGK
jgi:hypothetical protein